MKNTNKFLALLFAGTLVACNSGAPEATVEAGEAEEVATPAETETTVTYNVNTEGDELMWEGYKTFNVGDAHNGTLQVSEGNFVFEGENLVGGEFTIDMKTINSLDLAESPEYKAKLEGHLMSPDFFAVDSFPTATFVITGAQAVAADDTTGATHNISGNLTLRGITKNITIPAMVEVSDAGLNFSTPEFVIDRSQWDVKFRSTSFAEFADLAKDKVIDNNMKLKVSLSATKA